MKPSKENRKIQLKQKNALSNSPDERKYKAEYSFTNGQFVKVLNVNLAFLSRA